MVPASRRLCSRRSSNASSAVTHRDPGVTEARGSGWRSSRRWSKRIMGPSTCTACAVTPRSPFGCPAHSRHSATTHSAPSGGRHDRLMTLTAPLPVADPSIQAVPLRRIRSHHVAFAGLLTLTGALYLWGLAASGWANSYYSAAVQAGSQSWTAFLFGCTDAGNAITVDKTPGALWVMDASVRLFGFNSWSVLAPEALEGVVAVAVLYAAVRRINGPAAGLLAGAVLALTPVATLMFRFNNPDALLVLLLAPAPYCAQPPCEKQTGRWWLPLAGVALGFAFLAKMAQAFLVGPGFAVAYLLTAAAPLSTRVKRMAAAGVAMLVSGGWYLLLLALW